jgi:hypothetical protein
MLHPRVRGREDARDRPWRQRQILLHHHSAGVNAAAFGEILGALFRGQGRDRGGFFVGGVILPEPDLGVEIVGNSGNRASGMPSAFTGMGVEPVVSMPIPMTSAGKSRAVSPSPGRGLR